MNKLLFLALTAGCGAAMAQTGAQVATAYPMPDGSRDTYLGLGVQSAPRWEGAGSRRVSVLPVLQAQWSNGIFVSGMTAGMHLSDRPTVEFGPLLTLQGGRDASGAGRGPDGVGAGPGLGFAGAAAVDKQPLAGGVAGPRLAGLDDIGARLLAGAFANVYLTPQWRLTGSVLAGAGNERDGARLDLGVQRLAAGFGEHGRVSLAAGVGIVNRHYSQAWFGVTPREAARSRFAAFAPGGGLQDVHVGVRWNWDWAPSWMLTTNLEARRLLGSARNSPLVERPANLTASTAVAYRF
jgi:outer membrane protein